MDRISNTAATSLLICVLLAGTACSGRSESPPPPPPEPRPAPVPQAQAPAAPPAEGPSLPPAAPAAPAPERAAPAAERAAEPNPTEPVAKPTERAAADPGAVEPATGTTDKRATAAVAGPCGEKGQPPCPLQAWMERNLQQPLDEDNLLLLSQGFARVPRLVPDPSWNEGPNGWSAIAQSGAAAAKRGDADNAKQSCKTCHKTWRRKYKEEFRKRPI